MASGTPVAAYPVDGPLEVLPTHHGAPCGGVMHADLRQAWRTALAIPGHEARTRSLDFSWAKAARLFEGHLVATRQSTTDTLVSTDTPT